MREKDRESWTGSLRRARTGWGTTPLNCKLNQEFSYFFSFIQPTLVCSSVPGNVCGEMVSNQNGHGPGPMFWRGREQMQDNEQNTHRFAKCYERSQQDPQERMGLLAILHTRISRGSLRCEFELRWRDEEARTF